MAGSSNPVPSLNTLPVTSVESCDVSSPNVHRARHGYGMGLSMVDNKYDTCFRMDIADMLSSLVLFT